MIKKIVELIREAQTKLPLEVERALRKAYDSEENEIARLQLKNMLENIKLARELSLPICQDTGIPYFFVELGKNKTKKEIEEAIIEGVKLATEEVPLRPNVVSPLTRENSGNNVGYRMPIINWKFSDKSYTEIIYFPKGAGSENMSRLKMLRPNESIEDFVLKTVKKAQGNPCPPTIVGIGIGGSFDFSAKLAKEALIRDFSEQNSNENIAKLEERLLRKINALGIGPMGMGGKTTCLKVSIEVASCHTASLPVAVNLQCWAHRIAKMKI